jgi:tetratricopeptide (TPR) repeat protein
MKNSTRLLLVAALLAAPLLRAQAPPATTAPARPQDDAPVWSASWPEAVERARAMRDGRILVEVREAECPECERMAKLVYPSASFRAFLSDKVPVRLDRASADAEKLVQRFGVQRLPAWLVVTPELLLCGKQEGATNQSTWIERFTETERDWARFLLALEAEKKAPSDPAAAFAAGESAYRHFGDALAAERFRRVADDPKAPAALREKSLAYLAALALADRRLDDAEKALRTLLATSKDPGLRAKAELRLADVDLGRGDRRKAADRLRAFLASHPDSPDRPEAEALLQAIEAAKP